MTLNEAIKHAEEVAKKQENNAKSYPRPDKNVKGSGKKYNACLKCAEEHRQLAEWLKELKQLREQTRWIPISKRLPNHNEYIKNNGLFIVSDSDRSYFEWFDIYDTQRFGEPILTGFRVDYAVIAWMPLLPEPYKVESEEQTW